MTKKELLEALKEIPDDMEIYTYNGDYCKYVSALSASMTVGYKDKQGHIKENRSSYLKTEPLDIFVIQ